MLYYPPHICTTWPLYDYIGTIFQKKSEGDLDQPTHPFQSYLGFQGGVSLASN